jgi:hypothetical protein
MSDLYQTKEWKGIPARERYCLLPTMEDVRPGALIKVKNPQAEALEYCLQEKGMKSQEKKGLWFVSKDEKLLEEIVEKSKSYSKTKSSYPINEEEKDYHISIGEFFGYPECCVKTFIKSLDENLSPAREWHKKAGMALLKEDYNNLFDYKLHVPCGLECKCTLKIAEEIKKCLETYDLEAAEHLRKFNRNSIERAAEKCITT